MRQYIFRFILMVGLFVVVIGCSTEIDVPYFSPASTPILTITTIPPSPVPITSTSVPSPVVSKTSLVPLTPTPSSVVKTISSPTKNKPNVTSTINIETQATEQASSMFSLIKDLQSRDYLNTTDGTYHRLNDHEVNVIREYDRKQEVVDGYYPAKFVLKAEIAWSKPSAKALDKESSGCGFAFLKNPKSDFEFKIQLDGKADIRRLEYDNPFSFKTFLIQEVPFRAFVNQGKEEVILIVNGNQVSLLVNGREIIKGIDEKLNKKPFNEGVIAFSMENGSLPGQFSCNWSNIELWEIDINSAKRNGQITPSASIPSPQLNAEDYYNLGVSLYQKGDYKEAIVNFTRSIELAPDVYVSYYSRGILNFTRGDYPDALNDLSKAIELNQNLGILYYRRGQIYQRTGDTEKANADFEKAKQFGYTE